MGTNIAGSLRRVGAAGLIAALLFLAFAPDAEARGRRGGPRARVTIGIGPSFWWGPVWWRSPAWYYPPPAYVYPRTYVIEQPTVYVQQAPTTGPLEAGYWYYCQSAAAYYPTAPSCPEAWVKVPPRTE